MVNSHLKPKEGSTEIYYSDIRTHQAAPLCYNDGTRGRSTLRHLELMAKRLKDIREIKIERPARAKLSAAESLKRTQEFDKRREKFIASIRKSKG